MVDGHFVSPSSGVATSHSMCRHLADCYTRLGGYRAASDLYTWMRSARHLGFTRDELATIVGSAGTAARAASVVGHAPGARA